jgi:hypothetical protein
MTGPREHYYGDGCPDHPALTEGRPVAPGDPAILPAMTSDNIRWLPIVAPFATGIVLRDVVNERDRAEAKFPGQHLPDGTGQGWRKAHADFARQRCKDHAAAGTLTWRHVLSEEVAEALAETDPVRLRAELVQVANVAVRWVEDLDLRSHQTDGREVGA